MEYLDNKRNKITEADGFQVDRLSGDGEITKVSNKPQMTSFKLYTGKLDDKSSAKAKVEKKNIPIVRGKILFGHVSLTEKMMFMDNLSTMLKAGLALSPSLKTLKKEIKNKHFKEVVDYLERHVDNGQLLSLGMKNYPKIFNEMIVTTIEVGENTGMLTDSFGHLADILKAQKKLRSKITGALMYPSIVLIALLGVSTFLALFIFPQLVDLFKSANVKLPFVLLAVEWVNFFIRNYGWYFLGGLIIFFIILRLIFQLPKPKFWLHSLLLKVPFAGNIIKETALTSFFGNLHALLAAGLSIVKSIEIVATTSGNMKYRKEILEISQELEKGMSLEKSLDKRPELFPSLTVQLCQVGETTGELESILLKISKYYEERVSNVLSNLSTIIEPVLLIIVGVAVGFIALSVISPMYQLTSSFAN